MSHLTENMNLISSVQGAYMGDSIREPICDIFGVPFTYETRIFLWLLVKMQIVE